MPAAALEAEVAAYLAELADERDEAGRRMVVRNGYRAPRTVTTMTCAPARVRARAALAPSTPSPMIAIRIASPSHSVTSSQNAAFA